MHYLSLLLFIGCTLMLPAQETATTSYDVKSDIVWANPGGTELSMDIYSPEGSNHPLPVLVIFHGGGWLINTKSIMDEMSAYIADTGKYVVCNVDYRLLTANNNTTTMDEIIEDAMGAVLWVKDHIRQYGGDPEKIAVTGDSAGGHLAAMILNGQELLGSCNLSASSLCYTPSYMPAGTTPESIVKNKLLEVQAAILSYPATDLLAACLGDGRGNGFESNSNFFWQMGGGKARGIFGDSINANDHPRLYKQASPLHTLPKDRKLPPVFCHVGALDNTTPPTDVKAYADALRDQGAAVTYKEYPGKPHAYLDSGSNEYLNISFEKDAIGPLNDIIAFLDGIFKK